MLDNDFRRRINRQLNKGESLHSLRRFLFFANEGNIRQRFPEEQTKPQANSLNLVDQCHRVMEYGLFASRRRTVKN